MVKEVACAAADRGPTESDVVDKSLEQIVAVFPETLEGLSFASEKAAVQYYSSYAEEKCFVVRLDELRRLQNGSIRSRDVVCHRQGRPPEKRQVTLEEVLNTTRSRPSSRCGCQAMLRVIREVNNAGVEEWIIQRHVKDHNHSLLSPEEMSLLAAYRYISPEDGERIKLLRKAGLKVSDILNVLRLEKGEALSFNGQDVRNYIRKEVTEFQDHKGVRDVAELLKTLKEKQERDNRFFYDFTVDEDGRLENILWIPASVKDVADIFADVVVFDTTYRLNRYNMPFGCFAGVNNHGQTIILGGTLMRNETTESFQWIFKSWCSGIGRFPGCLLTDQDRAMKEAVAIEMPTTKHAFCLWHITQKFPSWFHTKLGDSFQGFLKDFYSVLEVETPVEFETIWFTMMERYVLTDDRHIVSLFELREFWCPVYLRSHFLAGMLTTQRSENLNALMDFFMSSQINLKEFIDAFDRVVASRSEAERAAGLRDKLSVLRSVTSSRFEEQAFEAFTDYAFRLFKQELVSSLEYVVQGNEISHHQHKEKKRTVSWEEETTSITCSCLGYEFSGILCRHSLRALGHFNVVDLPVKYFPKRWLRGVPHSVNLQSGGQRRKSNSLSEAETWKRQFTVKFTEVAQQGACDPVLRPQLETDLKTMHAFAFGAASEDLVKEFPPVKGKRLLVQPSLVVPTPANCVLVDKTNVETVPTVTNPPVCVTKGRPKSKRLKSNAENITKPVGRKCAACGEIGSHDKRNCPSISRK